MRVIKGDTRSLDYSSYTSSSVAPARLARCRKYFKTYMGACQDYGYHFRGPHNKDYSILGSILGSPFFGKLPYAHVYGYAHLCNSTRSLRAAD